MGGSSNSLRYTPVSREEIIKKIKDSNDQTELKAYETAISNLLDQMLGQFNNRDTELIQQHLDNLLAALSEDIEGAIRTRMAGSVSKRTHLKGLSDIDALVMLNRSELVKLSPRQVLDYFFAAVSRRLPNTKVEKGETAITVNYADGVIQLIPAIRYKTSIKIPDRNDWSTIIKPETFSRQLTSVNSDMDGKLIPAIKLIKGIVASFPESNQLKGYHIESLALQIFSSDKKSGSEMRLKDVVSKFFSKSPRLVQKPLKDTTGQSVFVDEYLGKKESIRRLTAADNLERTYRQMELADAGRILSIWTDLFSNMF